MLDKNWTVLYYINMENILNNITFLEEKVTLSLDLLEIAKGYCEHNYDKGPEVVAVGSIMDVIAKVQKDIADDIDKLVQF